MQFGNLNFGVDSGNAQAIQMLKDRCGGKEKLYDFFVNKSKFKIPIDTNTLFICLDNFYLPPFDEATLVFMLDVLEGRKNVLKKENLNKHSIPKFSELKVEFLLSMCKEDELLKTYLPDKVFETNRICRKFLTTVISTIKPVYVA